MLHRFVQDFFCERFVQDFNRLATCFAIAVGLVDLPVSDDEEDEDMDDHDEIEDDDDEEEEEQGGGSRKKAKAKEHAEQLRRLQEKVCLRPLRFLLCANLCNPSLLFVAHC
jgi:hypothetical protein